MKRPPTRIIFWSLVIIAALIGMERLNGTSDFNHIYLGIECALQPRVIYDCSPYYRFPPVFAYILAPLSPLLHKSGTFVLVMVLQLLSLYVALEMLQDRDRAYTSALLLIVPIADTLFLGQINIMAFASLPLIALLLEEKRTGLSHMLITISAWIKALGIVYFPHFLGKRPLRFVLNLLLFSLLLLGIGLSIRGPHLLIADLNTWLSEMVTGLIRSGKLTERVYAHGFVHYKNYTLLSVWKSLHLPTAGYILLSLLMVLPSLITSNRSLSFGILALSGAVLSPISWLHYYVFLLLPTYNLLTMEENRRLRIALASILFSSFVLTAVPAGIHLKTPLIGALLLYGWHLWKSRPRLYFWRQQEGNP